MRFNCKVAVVLGVLLSNGFVAAYADNVQSALDSQARNIQNEMNRGQISPAQAVQMENKVYQTAQQSQMDRAMNGGHINGWQRNQLGAQMQGIQNMNQGTLMRDGSGYGNGYNNSAYGYNNGGFSHHHNWAQAQNGGYGAPPPWTQGNQNNYQQMGNNWQNQQYAQGQQQSGIGGMLHRFF
jgi:hypothetical protein